MRSLIKQKIKYLPILCLVFITLWLRLVNLGYSDYQGDEIKVLTLLSPGQNLLDFLYQQKKGPVQYVLTSLVYLIHPTYREEFLTRLPFALAGILGIFFFYRLVKLHFGSKIALYASLFLAINGIFVGLTRIVQYQSLVILFSVLSLYAFSLALKRDQWKIAGVYFGMLFWAIALLSHYDGIFIAPLIIYLLYCWYRQNNEILGSTRIKHLVLSITVSVFWVAVFYLPFAFSIPESTWAYWLGRLGEIPGETEPASSIVTFSLYNPLSVIYLYVALGLLSLFKAKKLVPILVWFLFPWIILELVIYDPGTHIYTYLLPAAILLAFGVVVLEELLGKLIGSQYSRALNVTGLVVMFAFLSSLAHFIYVDHTPEYPWEKRGFLLWTIGDPDTKYHLWAFGFPYNRFWEEIGEFVSTNESNGFYATNENKSIASFYVPFQFDINRSGYYIHIHNPQSFRDKLADDKIRYWTKRYEPVQVFENHGRVMAEVYLMPEGNVAQIKEAGY